MSYGADFTEPSRVAGTYVGLILRSKMPADLPVQQAVKIELLNREIHVRFWESPEVSPPGYST